MVGRVVLKFKGRHHHGSLMGGTLAIQYFGLMPQMGSVILNETRWSFRDQVKIYEAFSVIQTLHWYLIKMKESLLTKYLVVLFFCYKFWGFSYSDFIRRAGSGLSCSLCSTRLIVHYRTLKYILMRYLVEDLLLIVK